MTLPINYQQPYPNHSGITINITNPVMNPASCCSQPQCNQIPNPYIHSVQPAQNQYITEYLQQNNAMQPQVYQATQQQSQVNYYNNAHPQTDIKQENVEYFNNSRPQELQNTSYPAQYYMNNYNYANLPQNIPAEQPGALEIKNPIENTADLIKNTPSDENHILENQIDKTSETKDTDLSLSQEIIKNIDEQKAAKDEAAKNEQKVKVVALTNEYIMSLEDYLNNPNNDIRYTAAKEILTRLDEDKSRRNDAALNALLNKMLQDPDKSIRVAAMSALASELASGNEYTVKLLKEIQNNPNADKDDIVEAANILLKMSATTEYKYVPINNENLEHPQVVQ